MSWQVDGVWYHDSREYHRALAEQRARQARAEIDTLRGAAEAARGRAAAAEAGLRQARGDLARQERLQAELRGHVADLHRSQDRLRQAQQEAEARTARD